jgi:hypothetical protein
MSHARQARVQADEFAARVETADFAALVEDPASRRELISLLDRSLVLHVIAQRPLTKQAVGSFALALGFPEERRHRGRNRPGAIAQSVPGFEFVADFGSVAKPEPSEPRAPSYIETLHYDGISAYSVQANISVPPAAPHVWVDMRANYRLLPPRLKQLVQTSYALHAEQPPARATLDDFPDYDPATAVRRPLLIRHPKSGEPLLYLPKNRASRIEGMSPQQGRELLGELWQFVESSPARFEVRLADNELVIWDGLGTMHTNPGYPRDRDRSVWFFVIPAAFREPQPHQAAPSAVQA